MKWYSVTQIPGCENLISFFHIPAFVLFTKKYESSQCRVNGRLYACSVPFFSPSKFFTVSRGLPPPHIYPFAPPSGRHYQSEHITCYTPNSTTLVSCLKIKPPSRTLAKAKGDVWYLHHCLSWGSLSPALSLCPCFLSHACHLIWLDVSLDCLDPGFTRKSRSSARHIGLKFWGMALKKNVLNLSSHF